MVVVICYGTNRNLTGNPPTLLVGMEIGAAGMDISVEIPQEIITELPYDPAILLPGIYLDKL